MLNFSYLCTYDLLHKIPSLTDPSKSVKQEIDDFNGIMVNLILNAHPGATSEAINHPPQEKPAMARPSWLVTAFGNQCPETMWIFSAVFSI
jgi:hypothetical protein